MASARIDIRICIDDRLYCSCKIMRTLLMLSTFLDSSLNMSSMALNVVKTGPAWERRGTTSTRPELSRND